MMWAIQVITTATGLICFALSSNFESKGNWHMGSAGFAFGVAGFIASLISMIAISDQLVFLLLFPLLLNLGMLGATFYVLTVRIRRTDTRVQPKKR